MDRDQPASPEVLEKWEHAWVLFWKDLFEAIENDPNTSKSRMNVWYVDNLKMETENDYFSTICTTNHIFSQRLGWFIDYFNFDFYDQNNTLKKTQSKLLTALSKSISTMDTHMSINFSHIFLWTIMISNAYLKEDIVEDTIFNKPKKLRQMKGSMGKWTVSIIYEITGTFPSQRMIIRDIQLYFNNENMGSRLFDDINIFLVDIEYEKSEIDLYCRILLSFPLCIKNYMSMCRIHVFSPLYMKFLEFDRNGLVEIPFISLKDCISLKEKKESTDDCPRYDFVFNGYTAYPNVVKNIKLTTLESLDRLDEFMKTNEATIIEK
jgi:hypothetical protein